MAEKMIAADPSQRNGPELLEAIRRQGGKKPASQ